MRILLCIPTLGAGGAERQVSYLAPALVRLGHDVHVACGSRGAFNDRLVSGGVAVHDVGTRGSHDLRLLRNLVRLMRALQPDVVNTFLLQMDVAAGIAALLTRTPWVISERSAAEHYPAGWKRRLRVALGRRAATIISNSRGGDDYWREAGALRRAIVRSAVPLDEIDRIDAHRDRKSVLFAGRMEEGKNAGTLLEALKQLDVEFAATFCGEGSLRPELERRAAGRVEFPGSVADLWERMKGAAVFVSLSRYEGCPNVVLEAMACGCPLVLSDIAAHRELLGDDAALFVPPNDAAAAAAAIRSTLLSRADAEARARVARRTAEQWSIESMAREVERIYASALHSPAHVRAGRIRRDRFGG